MQNRKSKKAEKSADVDHNKSLSPVPLVYSKAKTRKVTWRKYAYVLSQRWLKERNLVHAFDSKATIMDKRNSSLAEARNAIQIEINPELHDEAIKWALSKNRDEKLTRRKAVKLAKKNIESIHKMIEELGGSVVTIYNINGKSHLKFQGTGAKCFMSVFKSFKINLADILSAAASFDTLKFVKDVADLFMKSKRASSSKNS